MRIDYLTSDIILFRGDSLAALATAFIDGERVLLVDGLASQYDAIEMRDFLENTLHKRVERIVLTDGGGAHAAAVALFPGVELIKSTDRAVSLAWGRHILDMFQAPGAGQGVLAIDVPSADLLFVADSIVGNIATLGSLTPEQADDALVRLQERGRGQVVPRYAGAACGRALGNARAYLARLEERVVQLRTSLAAESAVQAIARIAIDDCLVDGEFATPLERHWHANNLKQIAERQLFPAAATQGAAKPVRSRTQACCDTITSVLTAMLGRLAERA